LAQAYPGIGEGAVFEVDLAESGKNAFTPDDTSDSDDDDDGDDDSTTSASSVDSEDEEDDTRCVFLLGNEEEEDQEEGNECSDDEDEDSESNANMGELALRDLARSLANREVVRAKYSGAPKESIYSKPLPLTGTTIKYHQTFGRIKSKGSRKR